MNNVPAFTASQIATAMGVTPQRVRQWLGGMDDSKICTVVVRGQASKAWPVDALPADVRLKLAAVAERHSGGDVTQLLDEPPDRWKPCIPLAEIAPRDLEVASKRRAVLAPILRSRGKASIAELVRRARAAFKQVAGCVHKSDRTIRRWIEMAQDRDRGEANWERLELYLDEQPTRRPSGPPVRTALRLDLPYLQDALQLVSNPANPTERDRHSVWVAAMVEVDSQVEAGRSEQEARRLIVLALREACIPPARTLQALRKTFARKRQQWIDGARKPSAIVDHRPLRSGNYGKPIPEPDRLALITQAVRHGGRISEGFREAVGTGKLSPATAGRFIVNPANKSYVPRRIREAINADVRLLDDIHHGPHRAELNGAYLDRDWSAVEPGDWWQGDDLTPPVYYWEDTPDGLFFGRGQLLVMIDVRSTFILGWVLHSDRVYNARIIRSLITKCHDAHGLPRRGFYFERGIWKSAKLLTGSKDTEVPLQDTELGLREFCEFRHARLPRAKLIERVLGLVQNQMESLPGYAGRDERHDRYERLEKQKLDVGDGRIHPAQSFMEKRDWMARLDQIFTAYNKTPQQGKVLAGVSPQEMYEARKTADIVQLDVRTRYLLANHRMSVNITANGIRLPKSMGGGLYRNAQTGKLIGRRMLVWVDVDDLQTISVTDINCRDAFVVERADPVPAMDASPEELARAMAQRDAHNSYARALYRVIKPQLREQFYRPVIADRQAVELGAALSEQTTKHRRQQMSYVRTQQTVREMERRFSVTPAPNNDPGMTERVKRGMELMKEALGDEVTDHAGETGDRR